MALRFDITGLTNEILDKLQEQLEYAFVAWRTEVLNNLKHPFYGTDMRPEVSYYFQREAKTIVGFLQANTYVLADSYGTGSLMVLSNPGYEEYRKSDRWNPERKGKTIVGRREGYYKDVFGRRRHSKGGLKGVSLEYVSFRGTKSRKDYTIMPTKPSYAVQLAEKWLYATYLPRAYKYAIREVNFAKYLKES